MTYSVKSVVNKMFDIFAHSDLSHQFILVSVHSLDGRGEGRGGKGLEGDEKARGRKEDGER